MDQFYHGSNDRLILLIHVQTSWRLARYGVPKRAKESTVFLGMTALARCELKQIKSVRYPARLVLAIFDVCTAP